MHKVWRSLLVAALLSVALCAVAGEASVALLGEGMTNAPVSCAPFPDRLSAYVWRNWFVVPHERLAVTIGAKVADLENIAQEMGLPRDPEILPEWRRRGYITVLRRNWHLLDYPQLMQVLDMTRQELAFSLKEDDFLWSKVGQIKPKCGPLKWSADQAELPACRAARRRIAGWLREEKIDDFTEEPRFQFVKDLKEVTATTAACVKADSPFDMRLIFSYFADYGDPLADPEIGSFPEGLLQKLAAQGVNAVWMHTVLNTLAKDPKYPEFGAGSEARMAHLRKLVARCQKYGIKVYLYMNEPRAQAASFFEKNDERRAMKGASQATCSHFAMCTSHPETRRWMRDAVKSVFRAAPGLGGIFTITMSENLTNCGAKGNLKGCPRCSARKLEDIIAEQNAALIEGMHAADPNAQALVWNWSWPYPGERDVLAQLPKKNCRVMAVSEGRMNICRGGFPVQTHDYSLSTVGPSARAREFWSCAQSNGLSVAAKVQANTTWELSSVPYLPVMDLVAEEASNLVKAGVDGVMLSWSLGCAPAPNLRVYNEMGKDGDVEDVLNRLAVELYGPDARTSVRKAWSSFSNGFREFPFSISVVYSGPMQWGPANPLYMTPTGYRATMVGFPYDATRGWVWPYPNDVWVAQMQKTADGFEKGCAEWRQAINAMRDPGTRRLAEREMGIFRTAALHFASAADQVRLYAARDAGNKSEYKAAVQRELARAKEELALTRADSRIGYESSNHYFFTPQDLREKVVGCRAALAEMDGVPPPAAVKVEKNEHPFIWSVLVHFGMNQWHDHYMAEIKHTGIWGGLPSEEYVEQIRLQYQTADHVRFDEKVWREVSEDYARRGINTIIIDVGEILAYPSHPELAVKGSWSPAKLRAEIARLRKLGFEVLPKLNFSSTHDAWLKEYGSMLSTPVYYKVVADLIADVCDIFDNPRLFHIGYDEEFATMQRNDQMAIVRQGELWWHDVLFTGAEVKKHGARPWIWIDWIAQHPKESNVWKRLPRDFVVSPWYYEKDFTISKHYELACVRELVQRGYDVIPTGSTCFADYESLERWAKFAREHLISSRMRGFCSAPWVETSAFFKKTLLQSGESMQKARAIWEKSEER